MYLTRSTTLKNIVRPISSAPAAKNVIFLSADAFGVLPPVSILTEAQTQYYFLSGFTAKLAGTERGITEPTPTFSACFGQAFLELHPTKYAEELVKKMEKSGAKRLTLLTQDGTEQENVSPLKILVESSTLSLTEQSTKLLQRQSHTSTSKYLQSLRVLTQESLILVTHTLTLLSGMLRQKTLLRDSSRTSLNTKEMKLVKHLLLQVLSCKIVLVFRNFGIDRINM